MGTNYYLYDREKMCDHCGLSGEPLHIGKSSAGWCFLLRVYPHPDRWPVGIWGGPGEEWKHVGTIETLNDWVKLFRDDRYVIRNEYGNDVSVDEMISVIIDRSWPSPVDISRYGIGAAVRGPNNLARHPVASHCIGHGDGPYDYIVGEFS